jgi:hypothetical protein
MSRNQEPAGGAPPKLSADMQRCNSGGHDERGRFAKGNVYAFMKGRSGNPRGRPRSALLSDALRRTLAEVCPEDPEKTWAEVIADQLIAKAAAGDVSAAKEIADRTEGKTRQAVTLTHDKREVYERGVAYIMEESGCSREDAIKTLAIFRPDVLELLNVN